MYCHTHCFRQNYFQLSCSCLFLSTNPVLSGSPSWTFFLVFYCSLPLFWARVPLPHIKWDLGTFLEPMDFAALSQPCGTGGWRDTAGVSGAQGFIPWGIWNCSRREGNLWVPRAASAAPFAVRFCSASFLLGTWFMHFIKSVPVSSFPWEGSLLLWKYIFLPGFCVDGFLSPSQHYFCLELWFLLVI